MSAQKIYIFFIFLYQFSSYDEKFWLEFAKMSENLYANLTRIATHYLSLEKNGVMSSPNWNHAKNNFK